MGKYGKVVATILSLLMIASGVLILFQGRDEASGLTLIVVGIASWPVRSGLSTIRRRRRC
jgi:hypothetical protein